MLAAWELGIGSCHASVYDEPGCANLLDYPSEMTCDLVVSFGYPEDPASLAPPGSRGGRKEPRGASARGALRKLTRVASFAVRVPTHSRGTERPSTGVSMGRPGGEFR